MGYKNEIDKLYQIADDRMNAFTERTNSITGMLNYMKLLGNVMAELAKSLNAKKEELDNLHPDNIDEITEYVQKKHNEFILTHRPK